MKRPISTAYYGGIFFDYVLQDRLADAVIILPNFPCHNSYSKAIKFWAGKGYHIFIPRYRGTYQSLGKFLSKNVVDDMIEFVENFDRGYAKNLWDDKKQEFRINKKILIAGGFSGAIACGMAAKSDLFSHLILASPIWDFSIHNSEGNEQDLQALLAFVSRSYKNCYRFSFKNLAKVLKKYEELHPGFYLPKLHDSKFPMLIFHDPNDKNVLFSKTKQVVEKLPNATLIEHYLGHGLNDDLFSVYWKDIEKFIKINYLNEEERAKTRAKATEKKWEEKVEKDWEKAKQEAESAEAGDTIEFKVVEE